MIKIWLFHTQPWEIQELSSYMHNIYRNCYGRGRKGWRLTATKRWGEHVYSPFIVLPASRSSCGDSCFSLFLFLVESFEQCLQLAWAYASLAVLFFEIFEHCSVVSSMRWGKADDFKDIPESNRYAYPQFHNIISHIRQRLTRFFIFFFLFLTLPSLCWRWFGRTYENFVNTKFWLHGQIFKVKVKRALDVGQDLHQVEAQFFVLQWRDVRVTAARKFACCSGGIIIKIELCHTTCI